MIILLLVFLSVAEKEVRLLIIFPTAEITQPVSSLVKLDSPPLAGIYLFFTNTHKKGYMSSQML